MRFWRIWASSFPNLELCNVVFPLQILAAECASVLSRQLASHVDDRTFPNTEEIMNAAIGKFMGRMCYLVLYPGSICCLFFI